MRRTDMIPAIIAKAGNHTTKTVQEEHRLKALHEKLADLEENFESKNRQLQSRLDSAENELHEVKMEVKQLKDSEVDEVSKLKTQLAQAEKNMNRPMTNLR